jgi:hypothetical protein
MSNRPVIIKNKKEKTCILMDVAIPANRNVMQKEAESKIQHKSVFIEIQHMWNMTCMIIPIITGATRMVTEGLNKNLEAIPRKHLTDSQ